MPEISMNTPKHRTLIVDDDPSIRHVIQHGLRMCNLDCMVAGSAEEAQLLIEQEQFDLFLIDWNLPDVDGITLSKKLASGKHVQTPKLLVTAATPQPSKEQLSQGDILSVVRKPFSPRELAAKVQSLLEQAA